MGGRQLSFLPESADEDGDQLDLIEEVAAATSCPPCADGEHATVEEDRCTCCGREVAR
jgi:hypothetical protein